MSGQRCTLTADSYHDWVETKIKPGRTQEQHVINFALGIASESGEITEAVKQHYFHGHELDLDNLKKELGDMLWYVSALARQYGWSLSDVMLRNIDKLNARYPSGFSERASLERDTAKE